MLRRGGSTLIMTTQEDQARTRIMHARFPGTREAACCRQQQHVGRHNKLEQLSWRLAMQHWQ
jgi:hypothetical protein